MLLYLCSKSELPLLMNHSANAITSTDRATEDQAWKINKISSSFNAFGKSMQGKLIHVGWKPSE